MGLNVQERGAAVATFRWIEVRLMEMLAAWVPTTPEMEAKLVFGAHIWDAAQHADALGHRTQELRLPLQHERAPADDYVELMRELDAVTGSAERVAAVYDVLLPALERRYREYLTRVDDLLDAPTVRIVERCLIDIERMRREGDELRADVPALGQVDAEWVATLERRERANDDIVSEAA
jgi:hypothetical protein